MSRSFTVVVDTREKLPWRLEDPSIINHVSKKLDTGDYTIEGLEDVLCIDRKASVSEIANNINQKRFHKELERIRLIPHAFIILEATADDIFNFPYTADLPPRVKNRIRINGKYLMRCLVRMQIEYGFNIIFGGSREHSQIIAIDIMKDVLSKYEQRI